MEYEIIEHMGILFRSVRSYPFEFNTFCKERWRNRTLFDIFSGDFKGYTEEYLLEAIGTGRILINGKEVSPDQVVRSGDKITHITYRCEPSVLHLPIVILEDLPNILVVLKPPSMPVHESGSYYKNTLTSILYHDYGYSALKQVHRLDRLTSGIVIFAKNSAVAKSICELMKAKTTKKWYFARVNGRFPYDYYEIDIGISCMNKRDGVHVADVNGKPCKTLVYFKKYDEDHNQSVVMCRLLTGRTHQIRVHLQHIGFPIANDICYGGEMLQPVEPPPIHTHQDLKNFKVPPEKLKQMEIWLYAFRYKLTKNLDFKAPIPTWAV